jgi:hypothetical protein
MVSTFQTESDRDRLSIKKGIEAVMPLTDHHFVLF